jgi:hypothetical protein
VALVILERGHELRQQCLAFRRIDGGWQREGDVVARRQIPFAVVDVAQRGHAGQDRGLAVRRAQESLAQRAHRASGRQQDQDIGQVEGIAAVLGQHAVSQLVGETAVDVDGEDALHPSTRSASASAAGVPTWNHWPSCTRP